MILLNSECINIMSTTHAYLLNDLSNLRVRFDIKRLIDENNVLKSQSGQNSINEFYFVFQLISHNETYSPKKYSKVYPLKLQLNQAIIFDWNYQNLSSDSRIAITIWSSTKKKQPRCPLGSTVISIFDENDCLRQGKYHLFVWPDVMPNHQWPTTTPGLTDDPNIQTLNFVADRKQNMPKRHIHDQRTQEALNIKLYYTYRLIPAAFLQVEFPKFACPVLYQDKLSNDSEETDRKNLQITHTDFNDCFQIYDPDFQANRLDPLEETFYFLKRENQVNPQKIQPKKQQLKIIDTIVNRTFKADNLKPQQKQLFIKYRYFLQRDKKYLIHYLHSVQWGTHQETEALKLIQNWDKIQWPDALHLLSKQFAANALYNKKKSQSLSTMKQIREHATQIIKGISDQIFKSILLQLIQTIRYDEIGDSPMARLIIQKSLIIDQVGVVTYWFLNTESEPVKQSSSKSSKEQGNESLQIYVGLFKKFKEDIQEKNQNLWAVIQQQEKFLKYLRELSKIAKQNPKGVREVQYRKRLAETNWQQFGPVAYPLDISIVLKVPIITQCSIFSSAMAPLRLTFQLVNGGKYAFMYKNGDDLRQDQLILGMFALMDKVLIGVNQDYKLTPYQALACTKSDGYVQFVPHTKTFQSISIKDYLWELIKKKSETVMQNYIFSTAGYCAITYFFMIGDRHLQNLLIDEQGKIFHIDFGFILGRDPKPYPPPIKISKEMIDAMGSQGKEQQQNFKKFKLKCLEAYLYLRKQAKMVYNLCALMLDSGIKDVHMQGLNKLFDKFSINLNDEEAQKYFLMVLEECKNALFPNIADQIHIWAGYFRK